MGWTLRTVACTVAFPKVWFCPSSSTLASVFSSSPSLLLGKGCSEQDAVGTSLGWWERCKQGTHCRSICCSTAPVASAGGRVMRLSKVVSCSSTSCSQTGMFSGEADRQIKGNAVRCIGRAGLPMLPTKRTQPW